jgi:hypothetical protein
VAHPGLGGESRIYLPPLHIKLSLIKISVTTMDKESEGFAYLRQKFTQNTRGQDETRNFSWSTNYATIRRPRLQYKSNFCIQKSLVDI